MPHSRKPFRSPAQPSDTAWTSPISDPLELETPGISPTLTPAVVLPEPIPTGLSDEADAVRHLAQRLNPDLLFCTNCETHYEPEAVVRNDPTNRRVMPTLVEPYHYYCPRCEFRMYSRASKATPLSTRMKLTK